MRRVAALLLALLAPLPAAAERADVRLLAGWREADRHFAGIDIRLPAGWHTYWRLPGAAGIAPSFDWSASRNLRAARVEWPHPEVFESFGIRTIGYHDGVVLPLLLTPEHRSTPIELDLVMQFGICKDICIPAEARLTGHLTPNHPAHARERIEAALATRAHAPAEAGVLEATCLLAADDDSGAPALRATVKLRAAPARPQVAIIEATRPAGLWVGEATAHTEGTIITAEARLAGPAIGIALDRSALRLTLIDAARTVAIEGCRAPD